MVMTNDARTDHPARPQGHAGQAEDFWGKGSELRRDPSTSHGNRGGSRVLFGVAGDTLVHEAARRFRCHSPIPTPAIPTATNGKPIPRSSGWIPATRYETRTACPQYWNPSPWARTR